MLFYRFKNYEEFKEIFGIIEHGNGVKSRKNLILLSLYKDKKYLKMLIYHDYYRGARNMRSRFSSKEDYYYGKEKCKDKYLWWHEAYLQMCYICDKMPDEELPQQPLLCNSLEQLKSMLYGVLQSYDYYIASAVNELELGKFRFFSNLYRTDHYMGLCEDKTLNAVRYYNIERERTFKMKAGKMFNHVMSINRVLSAMPEQIKRWLSEMFVADWIEYARHNLCDSEFTLHVDDNFSDIYDSECCAGYDEDGDSFGSCMVNDGQYHFYEDAVDAKAAYLTDCDNMIVARCVIFTNVHEVGSDKIWRLAERQYSKFCDLALQRQLVRALIQEGHIDGFKKVGASCHDPRIFLDNDGNTLEEKKFWVPCKLEDGDTLSYQDSFKWYDYDKQKAYNYEACGADVDLATTDEQVSIDNHDDECWSDYHDCYIVDYDATWVGTRGDYFYCSECKNAYVLNEDGTYYEEWCFEDDCIEVDGTYYYAGSDRECPEDYGLQCCPECDDWFVPERDNSVYSELTGEWYDCETCLESAEKQYHEDNGETYSDYDEKWFPEEDVILAQEWYSWSDSHYFPTSISIETFNNLVEEGKATMYLDEYYIDAVNIDGEPVHLLREERVVA